MEMQLFGTGLRLRAGLWLATAGLALCVVPWAVAQEGLDSLASAPNPTHAIKGRMLPDRLPDKPSQAPSFSIPVDPLGFSAPGPIYLGQRNSIVSLDFLDENRLLFTFRVPGLMHREAGAENDADVRQIRAVVLALPQGKVESEALWTVHDRARYLWMLKDGHFLLRDRENLELGDATLERKPYLRFPGPLLWLETDPTQQFLVTDSSEPQAAQKPGDVSTPFTASASVTVDGEKPEGQPEMVVRILRRDSGKVMLVSRIRSTVHLPINADGYLESLRGRENGWMLNLKYFSGGSTILGQVDSSCSPLFDFLSQSEVLVTACTRTGAHKLVAMSTDGRRLWEALTSDTAVWPIVVRAPDGSRLVREALAGTHAVNAYAPIDWDDIKGQLVEVLDAADGKVVLEAAASPALDAGGNVAISPSGRRVAVLGGDAIQIFELPAATPLPNPAGGKPAH